MHLLRMLAGALLLVPLAAHAESEYAACLKAQHQSVGPIADGNSRVVQRVVWPSDGNFAPRASLISVLLSDLRLGPGAAYTPTVINLSSADMADNRIAALTRACRQYRAPTPARFKVLGIKTPGLRDTGIRSQ